MLRVLWRVLSGLPAYLWSGWGALASLLLFMALWHLAAEHYGPLILPTTKAQFALPAHRKPARLFSHNDQQNTWQALGTEGITQGWGGRIGDLLAAEITREKIYLRLHEELPYAAAVVCASLPLRLKLRP